MATRYPFIERLLTERPDGSLRIPDAPEIPKKADFWVGLASSVAIEGYNELPRGVGALSTAPSRVRPGRNWQAMNALLRAWDFISGTDDVPEPHDLKVANRYILQDGGDQGEWRTAQVWVGSYMCPPASEVPAMMESYFEALDKWRGHPLAPWWAHLTLVMIHPWVDGNGRSSRLMEAFLATQHETASPWATTRGNWTHRWAYYRSLDETRRRNDPGVFYAHQAQVRGTANNPEYDWRAGL